jgi:hypothetical protein
MCRALRALRKLNKMRRRLIITVLGQNVSALLLNKVQVYWNDCWHKRTGREQKPSRRNKERSWLLDLRVWTVFFTLWHCDWTCGPRITGGPRQSAGDLGRKPAKKIVSDTEIMKNTPIHVFAKSASVTLTTGLLFLVFTACSFGCVEFYEWWMIRACADRLWSCPRLPKVWETVVYGSV